MQLYKCITQPCMCSDLQAQFRHFQQLPTVAVEWLLLFENGLPIPKVK